MLVSGAMFECKVLWQLGSVLLSQTCVTTKGYADDPDLGHYVELSHPSSDMYITLEKIGPDLMSSKLIRTLMAGVPLS